MTIHLLNSNERLALPHVTANCGVLVRDAVPVAASWDDGRVCQNCYRSYVTHCQRFEYFAYSHAFYAAKDAP
jgi:hypothetical protein